MQITIDSKKVELKTLTDFITAFTNAKPGFKVEMREVYMLETDNPMTAAILQTVFGGNGLLVNKEVTKAKNLGDSSRRGSRERLEAALTKKKTRVDLRYKLLTGEQAGILVTPGTVGILLKMHRLKVGDRLMHPVKGEFEVVSGEQDKLELQAVPA
jgi:hypothetical protein